MPAVSIDDAREEYSTAESKEKELGEKLSAKRIKYFSENKRFADYYSRAVQRIVQAKFSPSSFDKSLFLISNIRKELCENALNWFEIAFIDLTAEYSEDKSFNKPLKKLEDRLVDFRERLKSFKSAFFAYHLALDRKARSGFDFGGLQPLREDVDNSGGKVSEIYMQWFSGTVVGHGVVKKPDEAGMEYAKER